MGHQQFLWQYMQEGQSSYQLKRRVLLMVISISVSERAQMLSTWQKVMSSALARMDEAMQTELP